MSQMESGSVIVVDFQASLRTAAQDLAELEDELDRMAPVARDTDTVHAQVGDIKTFNGNCTRSRKWWRSCARRRKTWCSRASCRRMTRATHRWRHCTNSTPGSVSISLYSIRL